MKFFPWIFIVTMEIPQSWCHYYSDSDNNDQNDNSGEKKKKYEWKYNWNGETEYGPYQMKPTEYALFFNPFLEKQMEKENTCDNSNCQRIYEPVCDNLGNIYQNPCWFNYHQCEKRKLGLQLLAAPCGYYENGQRGASETPANCGVAETFEALHRLGINEIRMHLGDLRCSSSTAASLNSDFWLIKENSTFMSGRRLTEWKSTSRGWEIVNDYWVQDLD